MTTDYQFPKASPSQRDLNDHLKMGIMREINCHLIGKIEEVDLAKNTCSVSCAFKRRMTDGKEYDYPLFIDVPMLIIQGAGAFFFIPPEKGDWCLLEFNDRDLDSWWYSGKVAAPNSPRAHSLSDGIAIVGLRPQSDPIALSDDAATLDLAAYKLRLKNDLQNLKTLVDTFVDTVKNLKPIVSALNTPGTIDPATIAALTLLKTNFGLLLKE